MQKLVPVAGKMYSLVEHSGLIQTPDGQTAFAFIEQEKRQLVISSAVPVESRDHILALMVTTACAIESATEKMPTAYPRAPAFYRRLRHSRGSDRPLN